jgi:hypothetical protein
LFAGCGGLSYGLESSQCIEVKWAIEQDATAVKSYTLAHPEARVFNANVLDPLKVIEKRMSLPPDLKRYTTIFPDMNTRPIEEVLDMRVEQKDFQFKIRYRARTPEEETTEDVTDGVWVTKDDCDHHDKGTISLFLVFGVFYVRWTQIRPFSARLYPK